MPAWPRITCWEHLMTLSRSILMVVPPAPVSVRWPSGAKESSRTSQGSFNPGVSPERLRWVPVSMELQELSPPQLLEALVSVVATLVDVIATMTGPHRGVRRCAPPKLLHAALRIFTWSLRKGLEHPGVTSLGQALATFGATPGATWADVRAAASAWRELVAACEERWKQLVEEITKLRDACEDVTLAWARDQQDKATRRGTAGDNMAATAQQLMVALDRDEEASVGATRDAQVAMATEAMGEAVVATRRARAAIRRRHWAEVALEPLQRLVDACDKGSIRTLEFPSLLLMHQDHRTSPRYQDPPLVHRDHRRPPHQSVLSSFIGTPPQALGPSETPPNHRAPRLPLVHWGRWRLPRITEHPLCTSTGTGPSSCPDPPSPSTGTGTGPPLVYRPPRALGPGPPLCPPPPITGVLPPPL
ncbi:SWI/SNF complex subunit SMARCC1-like [Melospiza melodia melodia]|uniref:SWI/SNF complex subunit SMARCC1-like n=1 Tax=Melospiza melodia melodia TaxID=1914991 RepID=UPI002FD4E85A